MAKDFDELTHGMKPRQRRRVNARAKEILAQINKAKPTMTTKTKVRILQRAEQLIQNVMNGDNQDNIKDVLADLQDLRKVIEGEKDRD